MTTPFTKVTIVVERSGRPTLSGDFELAQDIVDLQSDPAGFIGTEIGVIAGFLMQNADDARDVNAANGQS